MRTLVHTTHASRGRPSASAGSHIVAKPIIIFATNQTLKTAGQILAKTIILKSTIVAAIIAKPIIIFATSQTLKTAGQILAKTIILKRSIISEEVSRTIIANAMN